MKIKKIVKFSMIILCFLFVRGVLFFPSRAKADDGWIPPWYYPDKPEQTDSDDDSPPPPPPEPRPPIPPLPPPPIPIPPKPPIPKIPPDVPPPPDISPPLPPELLPPDTSEPDTYPPLTESPEPVSDDSIQDNSNNNTEESETRNDPVEIATGNYTYDKEDIRIQGRGPDLIINRTYNSRSLYSGPFGFGWNHSYNIRLIRVAEVIQGDPLIIEEQAIIRHGFGRKEYFTLNQDDGTYSPPSGCFATLEYNADNTFTYRKTNGEKYIFNSEGLPAKIEDRNKNALTLEYDDLLRLLSVTDCSGRKLLFEYNQNLKIARIITATSDPNASHTFFYDYDQYDNLIRVVDPLGNITTYTYSSGHNLLTITDPRENKKETPSPYIVNTYDAEDRVVKQRYGYGEFENYYYPDEQKTVVINRKGYKSTIIYNSNRNPVIETDHMGNTIIKEWDDNMNITSLTDARGNTTSFEYDNRGNLIKITYPLVDPDTFLPVTTQMEYESTYNMITRITDPYGRQTRFEYDDKGNLLKTIDPMSNQVQRSYDSYGQLISIIDENLNETRYSYDQYGNITKIINVIPDAPDYVTEMKYDTLGNLTEVIDGRGNITRFFYDVLNRPISILDALNNKTEYRYDENGNIVFTLFKDSDGNILNTVYREYDFMDNLIWSTDTFGNFFMLEYDKNGNKIQKTDANLNNTKYSYDSLNRPVSITDPEGNVTQYAYDNNGNLQTITDALYRTTFFAYDGMDRRVQIKYPDMTTERYNYDLYGNTVSYTNRASETISYEYDNLGRLTRKVYPEGETIDYEYDSGDRITKITDTRGDIIYGYDALDRIVSVTYYDKTIGYAYDEVDNRIAMIYPENIETLTYEYDSLNRLVSIKDKLNNVIAHHTYDSLGRRTKVELGNGTETQYDYGSTDRLLSLVTKHTSTGNNISSFDYTYDYVGNRKSMTTPEGVYNYEYDRTYQLTNFINPHNQITEYIFDPMGNRISVDVASGTINYSVNNLNQYTQAGGDSLTYDKKGNLISDGTNNYTFNSVNRMIQAVTQQGSFTYEYDPLGRRYKRYRKNLPSGSIRYIYDGDQVIMEIDDASGAVLRQYAYGPGIDEPVRMTTGGLNYYYHFDGLGSVSAITNSTGDLVESYIYDPYGDALIRNKNGQIIDNSIIGNEYMFTGRRYDKETGFYYYRARYYSSQLGRFLSTDPIGFAGDMNLYRYVGNNALRWVDPWGLCGDEEFDPLEDILEDLLNPLPPDLLKPLSPNEELEEYIKNELKDRFNKDLTKLFNSESPQRWHTPDGTHVIGRPGTIVPEGGIIGRFIENNVASGFTFGEIHDPLTEFLRDDLGIPDLIANAPTMPICYLLAIFKDNAELSYDNRPQVVPFLVIRHDIGGK